MGKTKKQLKLAQAQLELNKQAAVTQQQVNSVNQVTPYGSLTYSGTPGTPGYTATQPRSPQQQALLDQQAKDQLAASKVGGALLGNVGSTLSKPLDYANFDPTQVKDNRLWDLQSKYLNEDYAKQDSALEQKLANQGIFPGMPAYNDARATMLKAQNYGKDQLLLQGDNQAFNQGMAGQQFADTRQRDEYTMPLNTYSALKSGTQVTAPTQLSTPTANVGSPDYLGIKAANDQAAAQKQAAMFGAVGSAAGAAGSAAMMSDRRAKTDIHKVGNLMGGINAYKYRMKGSPFMQIGVMADEVEKEMPEAVTTGDDGFKRVYYGKIAQRLAQAA